MKIKRIVLGIFITVFLLLPTFGNYGGTLHTYGVNTKSNCDKSSFIIHDAELPYWNIGDSWTYNIKATGEQNQYFDLDFDLNINNFKFEVTDIQDELYILSMTVPQGDFQGEGNIDLGIFTFSGIIKDASLNGVIYVTTSTLEIHKCQATISGNTNKIILPQFNTDFQLEFEIIENGLMHKGNFSSLPFPMNINDVWLVPFTYLNFTIDSTKPNLGQNILYSYINEHEVKCLQWDVLHVGTCEYDALKSSGINYSDTNDIWFCPAVGNIIKLDFKNVALGFGYILEKFTMNLKSTTYQITSDSPDPPMKPLGPTHLLAGESGTYETMTTDPDGNKIRYIYDWGYESENTYTDFINSGEQIMVSHKWTKKGNHSVRVKARDKYGLESDWSAPLNVNITNNGPNIPTLPDGASNGVIRDSYTYSVSTDDPDGHRIKYGFDWDGDDQVDDWTELVDSGSIASQSHTWYSKGIYDIKVKAQDEYGEQSDWSKSLTVSIPKNKIMHNLLFHFHKQFSYIFNILDILL